METKVNTTNEMMDVRVVRLNEIISTKLSSVSKGKRENFKAAKTAVKFTLENWDNAEALERMTKDEEFAQSQSEIIEIAKNRVEELIFKAAQKATDDAKADEEAERQAEVKRAEERAVRKAKKEATEAKEESKETKTEEEPKMVRPRGRIRVERKVGDVHPDGKRIWTEYKPGKFNWRWGRKAAEPTGELATPKAPATSKKESKPKTTKKTENKKQTKIKEPKVRTPQEILKVAPAKLSKSQETIFKLLRKGYKATIHTNGGQKPTTILSLEVEGKKQTNIVDNGAFVALMKRLRVSEDEMKQFSTTVVE